MYLNQTTGSTFFEREDAERDQEFRMRHFGQPTCIVDAATYRVVSCNDTSHFH